MTIFKILLVDDDKTRSDKIKNRIKNIKSGSIKIETDDVASINSAKKLLKSFLFDLLIVDIVLPKRDGDDEEKIIDGGITLVKDLKRNTKYKCPKRILGITSYQEQHPKFQEQFSDLCELVLKVDTGSSSWLDTIINDIVHRVDINNLHNHNENIETALVSIHGIRTFGSWQQRLNDIIKEKDESVISLSFSYGYLDLISFILPFDYLRKKASNRLYEDITHWVTTYSTKRFVFVAHSFGTYVLKETLEKISKDRLSINLDLIILCGSVLKSNYSWSLVKNRYNVVIINECGTNDLILWACNIFAPKLGMAGKTGFKWLNNDKQINRFHEGGHSLYFKERNDSKHCFMSNHWMPLIIKEIHSISPIDKRKENFFHYGLLEVLVKFLGYTFYPIAILLIITYVLYKNNWQYLI